MESSLITTILDRLERESFDLNWFSGKRILITGGAGFIGSWLLEALVRLDAKVFVVDNLWRGSLDNLKKEDGSEWIPFADQFLLGDLREYHTALSACAKAQPDLVYHLADIVAGIDYVFANESFLYRANVLINSNLFSAVRELSIPNLIYLGTACSYPQKLQASSGNPPLTEEQVYPADPESAYGWSKLLGEYEAELVAKNQELKVGVLRLHNVYGPRSPLSIKRSQVIPSLIRKAVRFPDEDFVVWGSGKQARDFVFVGDVVDALLRLPFKGMGAGPIQIGTATETTIADLASLIVDVSSKDIQIEFDISKPEGDGGRSGDYTKANKVLGWKVHTSLRDGLKNTYQWAENYIQMDKISFNE